MMVSNNLLHIIYQNQADLFQQVEPILAEGCDVNHITEHNESALRVAANNGRFDVMKLLLDHGADIEQLNWSATFKAIAFEDADTVADSIAEHDDMETRDYWKRTPLLLAIQRGDIEIASRLMQLGADMEARGHCGKSALFYAIDNQQQEMLPLLLDIGCNLDVVDDFQNTPLHYAVSQGCYRCAKLLIDYGANVLAEDDLGQRPIHNARQIDLVNLLVTHGDRLEAMDDEMHARLTGMGYRQPIGCSLDEYLQGRDPVFGQTNPQRMQNPFWQAMIRAGASAWKAGQQFRQSHTGPTWCYRRFGRSTTRLPDGRIIDIGGEHEDYYDPDFYIYNDVVVFHPEGIFDIYGYPDHVFPPIDFHSATLVNNDIYIIGGLGDSKQQKNKTTQVYRLSLLDMSIHHVETQGEMPAHIYQHQAYAEDKVIRITGGKIPGLFNTERDNQQDYALDLQTFEWKRMAKK